MQLLKHFKELTVRPKNAQELKGLILQLAIQGKLTANWRDENKDIEPASELLSRIQKEKERLIKERKIRKNKALPQIKENEIPFDIPDKWIWCRLQDCLDVRDGTHDSPKYIEKGIPLVTSKNLYTKRLDITNVKFISEKDHLEISRRSNVEKNDILFAMIGSIGNPVIVDIEPNFSIKNVALIKYYLKNLCLPNFVLFFLEYATKEFKDDSDGAVQSFVSLTKLRAKEFALPPLEEQKAIVEVVETLFKEVEQLEQLTVERITLKEDFVTSTLNQLTTNNAKKEWAFLQDHFHSFFNETTNIKKLRETVLQLAVQGKLTSDWRANNPDVEDASVLLKRIQKEKAQLIKDKKIKKEKPLPKIAKDDIPYELPKGWVWCHFGELAEFLNGDRGKNYPNKSEYVNEGIAWINTGHINPDGTLSANKMNYINREKFDVLRGGKIKEGDLVYCLRGATFGKTAFVTPFYEGAIASSLMIIRSFLESTSSYIYRFLISPEGRKQLLRFDNGSAQPNLSANKVKLYAFPLPPEEEQKVIVQKVNALMGLCEALEFQVQQSQEHSEQLMQSCLREVFEV